MDTLPQSPQNISIEALTRSTLNAVAVQLAASPVPQAQRKEAFERVLVNLANAAGVDMYGKTLQDASAQAPVQEVQAIAGAIGTQPFIERNKMYMAPFERARVGSGAVVLKADEEGRLNVLLVRHKTGPRSQQWELPIGYMDPLPASDAALPDRLSAEERSARDEAQAAGQFVTQQAAPTGITGAELKREALPGAELKAAMRNMSQVLAAQPGGWQALKALKDDGDTQRAVLEKLGVHMPKQYDLTARDNVIREVREEAGLDIKAALAADSQASLTQISAGGGLMSGGGIRPYGADFMYMADLGKGTLPDLVPVDTGEIAEAKWVRVKDIGQTELPLAGWTRSAVEEGLNALLSKRIKAVSGGEMDSVQNVQAALGGWRGKELARAPEFAGLAREVANTPVGEVGVISLLGQAGQERMDEFAMVAQQLTRQVAVAAPKVAPLAAPDSWLDSVARVVDRVSPFHFC